MTAATTFGFWSGRKKRTFPDVLAAEKAAKRSAKRYKDKLRLVMWESDNPGTYKETPLATVWWHGWVDLTFAGSRYL